MEYKEKLRLAKEALDSGSYDKDTIEYIFPELAESEDEKIRKELLNAFKEATDSIYMLLTPSKREAFIAWLEKQGEQKLVNKVEPRFKVGDTMRTLQEAANGFTDGMPVVVSIDDKYYRCNNELIAIKDQDDYEYPPMNRKQKPAEWSEEDEYCIHQLIVFCENCMIPDSGAKRCAHWLKSLKDRFTWKPSKKQMEALLWCVAHLGGADHRVLGELYEGLKKLREE